MEYDDLVAGIKFTNVPATNFGNMIVGQYLNILIITI